MVDVGLCRVIFTLLIFYLRVRLAIVRSTWANLSIVLSGLRCQFYIFTKILGCLLVSIKQSDNSFSINAYSVKRLEIIVVHCKCHFLSCRPATPSGPFALAVGTTREYSSGEIQCVR